MKQPKPVNLDRPPQLSIIIPAYNEAATIVRTLALVREYLDRQQKTYQIIVWADGNDAPAQSLRTICLVLKRVRSKGSSLMLKTLTATP